TGHVPFRGETPISTILKHLHEPPPLEGPPAEAIPAAMRRVLRRSLEKDPAQRYPNARTLAEALRQARSPVVRQQPSSTDALLAPTLASQAVRPRRRALQPWLLAVPVAAVAGGVFLVSRQMSRGVPDPAPAAVGLPTLPASAPAPVPTSPPVTAA